MRRRIAALVAAAVVTITAAVVVPATPAHAAACSSTTSGVTVVVDFSALGGGVEVGCASGDPSSGLAALQGAGFSWTGTLQFPGFVCRIDGVPSDDPCQTTSPSDAYWAYYHAQRGGSWTYSSSGPGSRNPAPGTVEGWAFGAGAAPGTAPPAAPAPAPAPPPPPPANPPPPPPAAAGGGSSGGGSGSTSGERVETGGESGGGTGSSSSDQGGSATERPAGTATDQAGPGGGTPPPATSPPASSQVTSTPPGEPGTERTAHTAGQDADGGLAGVMVAAALVTALAAGAFWAHRRRRSRMSG